MPADYMGNQCGYGPLRELPAAFMARLIDRRIELGKRVGTRTLLRGQNWFITLVHEHPDAPTAERNAGE